MVHRLNHIAALTFVMIGTHFLSMTVHGQGTLSVTTDAIMSVKLGAQVNVNGDVIIGNGTYIHNQGTVLLDENWVNNSGGTSFDNTSNGKVILEGMNQSVQGANATEFYDLVLQNSGAIKQANIDFSVLNTLDLENATLETNEYLVHLRNPNVSSLTWSDGFISTADLAGYFLRTTNSTDAYEFPLGSNSLQNTYRPIDISPDSPDSTVYGARLGIGDASYVSGVSRAGSIAPFDLTSKESTLGELNPSYFHNFHRFYGTSDADMIFYYFSSDENSLFSTLAKWDGSDGEWKDENFSISTNSGPSHYNNPNKTAINTNGITFNDDAYVFSDVDLIFPTTFTPNLDGFNDFFVIENLHHFPENELIIFNRWGEQVYYAKPYRNDWDGINTSGGIQLQGEELSEDTYYYILTLGEGVEPIKNFLEIIRD